MIYSELKKLEEIEKLIEKEKKVYFLRCKGCADVRKVSDEETVNELKKFVEENPFLFNEQNPDDDDDISGDIGTKTPKRGDMKTKDKKVSDIENKFPALRRVN